MNILDIKIIDDVTYYIVSVPDNSVIKPIQRGRMCGSVECSSCLFNCMECSLGIDEDDDLRQRIYEHFPTISQSYPEYFI